MNRLQFTMPKSSVFLAQNLMAQILISSTGITDIYTHDAKPLTLFYKGSKKVEQPVQELFETHLARFTPKIASAFLDYVEDNGLLVPTNLIR